MALSLYENKTLAECVGLKLKKVYKTDGEFGYTAIQIQIPGLDYGTKEDGTPRTSFCLLLGKACGEVFPVGTYPSKDCVITLAESKTQPGLKYWRLGRPHEEFVGVEDI